MSFVVKVTSLALLSIMPQICVGQDQEPAQVMMFGVFHFANPGHDVVKAEQINVMTEDNQIYLEGLADRIAKFNPTRILLEYPPGSDPKIQNRYRSYVDGSYELPSNEVYQLGFRIATRSDAETVHGFDENTIQWNAEPLFAYLEGKEQKTSGRMDELFQSITIDTENAHRTLTLQQLLLRANDAEQDRINRGLYLLTNHVGDGENYVGADAAASWWHRNFRMYANVQRHAQPGERVLVIGGQGHIAILRQFLEDDDDRYSVDVTPYF